ncbi:MAG: Blue-light-activated protein [Polyangiaceae bacterium]|jgi:PAS domain S-box-containing protein|nr:Blue-light-activated protein [Polyangiaceae bacterium]
MNEAEQRQRILEVMPDAAFINVDDRIAYCNPALLHLLGVASQAELLGKSALSLFHHRYHDVIRRRIEAMRAQCVAVPMIEEEVVHLHDGAIAVEVVATSLRHEGRPAILVILRDLRPRNSLQARFRLLVDAVTEYAIYTLDAAGRITSWNEGATRLHGYTVAEALHQPHGILFSVEDVAASAPERELEAALAAAPPFDAWRARKDGTLFWSNSVVTALRDSDGRPQGFVKVIRDLTERRGSQLALTESETRTRHLFDCVMDPLFIYDRESLSYLAVNDAAVAHYGYSQEEFLRMTLKDLRPAEDVPALLEMLSDAGEGQEARGVWRHKKKDGTLIQVEVSARGLSVGGRPACLIHARDVTARLEAERAAAEAFTALQQSQLLARIASEAARLGGWVVDLGHRTVTWSEEVCILHDVAPGCTPSIEEALHYYAPEHRAAIQRAVTECTQSGAPFDLELEILSAKNRRLWVRAIGNAVRDSAGRVVKIQGAFQDISLVRKGLEAVRLSEERFRLLSTVTNDAVWDWDMVTNAHWWNEGVETLFGYRRGEIEPTIRFCLDRIHPDDVEARNAIITRAIDSGSESWSGEYRFRHENGSYVWVLDRGYILRDPAGTAVRMIGGMENLTARKLDEERIAEQAALLDEARDAIVVRDLELRPTYWNRSAARLYGFDAQNIARASTKHLYVDPTKVEEALWTTLEHGGWTGELQVNGVGDRQMLVSSHWSLVRDKAGLPRALLIISTDITEKKNLEAQFIRAQRMESIGTLAGGIAHDLNNVLAPILASIEFLKSDMADNPGALDTLATLDICARRGADLVKQVLSFARGVDGERMTVNLTHLAQELLQVLEDTLPRSISLRFAPGRDLWTVTGDATQLHQVLLNLCVNARDAMPDGGSLEVSMQNIVLDDTYASMNVDARPGPYVQVQVRDTGTGIPPEIRERIFDPFFTTKEVGKGTGLGLSTTLTIVKGHGGFINVYSEPGKGTKFKVYIPADAPAAVTAEVPTAQTGLPRGHGELVLVVDDEDAIRKIVCMALERFGYEVMLASHGAEAVALFAQHRQRIALVLTDMAMPIMDGPATIIAIRAIDPDAKIVGSSGLTANGDVAKAVGAGVKHFVAKPYTAEALLSTLAKALGKIPSE